jgi:hypothetical protein
MEENSSTRDENVRQIIEWAINSGRKRLSSQTGFVHHFYHSESEEVQHTIPLVENALFVLALFRSRLSDNILEAKNLLDRLLSFQCLEGESKGNFPIYLHEYPHCKDRFLGAHLLPTFYWIFKQYQSVLGAQLTAKLEKAMEGLLKHCLTNVQEKPPSTHILIKIAASSQAIGSLIKNKEFEEEGGRLLSLLREQINPHAWVISAHLGDFCVALQMLYPSLAKSPWNLFWDYLSQTWHRKACCYVGPALKELQNKQEPQTTLYDLFMGYFSKTFSQRVLEDHSLHLQGALLQQSEDTLPPLSYPFVVQGIVENQPWKLVHQENFAFTLIEKSERFNLPDEKGFYPFRLCWGSSKRTHTFGCQGGNTPEMNFKDHLDQVDLIFTLGEIVSVEDREKARELAFYFDVQEDTTIAVNDEMSTTFKLQDSLSIEMEGVLLALQFIVEEGSGHFLGHVMRGNRPAQVALKGKRRFDAYDWQIFLRTLRRTSPCKIKATIRIHYA